VLAGFVDYLREQRGVSSLTVDAYVSDARRFVEHRENGRLRELTASEVPRAVLARWARESSVHWDVGAVWFPQP